MMLNIPNFSVYLFLVVFTVSEDKVTLSEHSIQNLTNLTRLKQFHEVFLVERNFEYALIAAEKTVSLVGEMMLLSNENNIEFHDVINNETNGQLRYSWLRPSIIQLSGSLWRLIKSAQFNARRMIVTLQEIDRNAEETLRLLTSATAETLKQIMPIYEQSIMEKVMIGIRLASEIDCLFSPTMSLILDIKYAIEATNSFTKLKINQGRSGGYNNHNEKMLKLLKESLDNLATLRTFWIALNETFTLKLNFAVSTFYSYCNATASIIQDDGNSWIHFLKDTLLDEISDISKVCMSLKLVAETYANVSDSLILCPANDFLCHHRNLSSNDALAIANDENKIRISSSIEEQVQDAKAEFQRWILKPVDFEKLFPVEEDSNSEDIETFEY